MPDSAKHIVYHICTVRLTKQLCNAAQNFVYFYRSIKFLKLFLIFIVMGKIARVASNTSSITTSLQKEVNYFTGVVAFMAVIICIITVCGYYYGVSPSHPGFLTTSSVVTNCIAVVVSLLPEGTTFYFSVYQTLSFF